VRTADFEYDLPPELIAQTPVTQRDESRLLVLHRASAKIDHRRFPDLLDYLRAGVVICGGGARIAGIQQLAERMFQLPGCLGKTSSIAGLKSALDQPEFATAIGLVKFGSFQQKKKSGGSLTRVLRETFGGFLGRK